MSYEDLLVASDAVIVAAPAEAHYALAAQALRLMPVAPFFMVASP